MRNHKTHKTISFTFVTIGVLAFVLQIINGIAPIYQFLINEIVGIILFGNLISYLTACYYEQQQHEESSKIMIFYVIINTIFIVTFLCMGFLIYLWF